MKAIAPGKIILSGEHAVVYGNSALVMAVNSYSTTQIIKTDEPLVVFSLPDFASISSFTLDEMVIKFQELNNNYQQFLQGRMGIRQVLTSPAEIFVYIYLNFLDRFSIKPEAGLFIRISSTLPTGCGMGSSASTIVSFISALAGLFEIRTSADNVYSLALAAEQLQHGYSSGIDPHIALYGGFFKFQKKQANPLPMPDFPFYIVNTGTPAASTGESVEYVAKKYRDSSIWKDFQAVTDAFAQASFAGDKQSLVNCVRENHRLLCSIGVVPKTVQKFIAGLEKQGGAGKISGAGSVRGERAGIVCVVTENELQKICFQYGYQLLTVKGEQNGARIV